jgi:Ketopantoate reductase PanE/ApbA
MADLIVGAGSVGQVLGLHLSSAGDHVGVLVRPAHVAQARSGYQLRRLRRLRGPVYGRFLPDRVIDDITLIHPGDWNIIWLCVSSTGLRGLGLEQLRARAISSTIVLIAEGVHDRAALENYWPADQVVLAAPLFLAFPGPPADPGHPDTMTSYWTPPGAAWQVNGTGERASAVVEALRQGGLKVKATQVHGAAEMFAAAVIPLAAQAEAAGWSLRAVRRDLGAASAAASEAAGIVAAVHGAKPPPAIARSTTGMRVALSAMSLLAPFDLGRYLRFHFTKVGAQTRLMLDDLIGEGAARGLSVTHLRELRAGLKDGSS